MVLILEKLEEMEDLVTKMKWGSPEYREHSDFERDLNELRRLLALVIDAI